MRILSNDNKVIDTDIVDRHVHYSVLSFRDYKNPDFFFEKLPHLDHIESPSIALKIGPYKLVMPLVWSVIITDYENLECVPIHDLLGKKVNVFCLNPIDGFHPDFLEFKDGMIYPKTSWTAPPLNEKDMLVVPLGYGKVNAGQPSRGPVCAIFSPTKMEINKSIADIW